MSKRNGRVGKVSTRNRAIAAVEFIRYSWSDLAASQVARHQGISRRRASAVLAYARDQAWLDANEVIYRSNAYRILHFTTDRSIAKFNRDVSYDDVQHAVVRCERYWRAKKEGGVPDAQL